VGESADWRVGGLRAKSTSLLLDVCEVHEAANGSEVLGGREVLQRHETMKREMDFSAIYDAGSWCGAAWGWGCMDLGDATRGCSGGIQ
jgi:hypothetical protein